MDADTPRRPRMSWALMAGWLLLTIDSAVFQLWTHAAVERAIEDPAGGKQAWETFIFVARVHGVAFLLVSAVLIAGLWMTAKARDASLLRQASGLYLAMLLIDTVTYSGLLTQTITHDAIWLDYSPLLSTVLMVTAGAFVLLYAQRSNASSSALLPPILAHLGVLLYTVSSFFELTKTSFDSPNGDIYLSVAVELFFWLAWLTLPSELFSLDGDASEPGDRAPLRS